MPPGRGAALLAIAAAQCLARLAIAVAPDAALSEGSCEPALAQYFGCRTNSLLFSFCSQPKLLNLTEVQVALGCDVAGNHTASLGRCQEICSSTLTRLSNRSFDFSRPCPTELQLMSAFSGNVHTITTAVPDPQLNMSLAVKFPVPNVVGTSGLMLSDMGNPAKCVGIRGAHYCVFTGAIQAIPGLTSTVALGLCLPQVCSNEDLRVEVQHMLPTQVQGMEVDCGRIKPLYDPPAPSFLQSAVPQATAGALVGGPPSPFGDKFTLGPVTYPSAFTWSWREVFAAVVCSIPLLLVVVGTVVEVVQIRKMRGRIRPEDAVLMQPLASTEATPSFQLAYKSLIGEFSLVKNVHQFMEMRPGAKNTFNCLDGFRVLSMSWVVLGHTFFYMMTTIGLSNFEQLQPPYGLVGSWAFQLVPGGFYAVDTFLWLSGFLCANSLNKRVFSRPAARTCEGFGKLYPVFMVMRYLRLLPMELFCILFCGNVLYYLGTGIAWNLSGGTCLASVASPNCKTDWWANALFIQNFYPSWPDKIIRCFGHTWYLAVDMQLYLVTPFLSMAFGIRPALGWAVWALATAASIGSNVFFIWWDKIIPSPIFGVEGFMGKYYAAPWIRAEPFLVGVAFAWLWTSRLAKARPTILWSVALSLLVLFLFFACVFWGQHNIHHCNVRQCTSFDEQPMGKAGLVAWGSCNRLAWGVMLSVLSFLSFHRRFIPVIQELLTLDLWQPVAKLCYSAYLIHPMWLVMVYCQRDFIDTYSTPSMLFRFFSVLSLTFLTALVLFLCVEQPLGNLVGRVLGIAVPA